MKNPASVPTAPNTPIDEIQEIFRLQRQHQYVVRRSTAKERIAKLRKLHATLLRYQPEIEAALWKDLHKSPTEVAVSELAVALGETRHTIKHLKQWMATQSVPTPLTAFGASSEIMYEPKGVCLIISPWNYPVNLSFAPLVSAIAAGNCVIIKPSEFTVHTSAIIKQIVAECFSKEEVAVVEGDTSIGQALLDLPFNHIFFTGSPSVGKIVMAAAAKNLTSVTLELGGKSPVIVDETADLDNAASKIAFLKGINVAQTCIAPDYILVHESVKDQLVSKIGEQLRQFYGQDAAARAASPDLCRLVNARHYVRVKSLLDDAVAKGGTVAFGGFSNEEDQYIETTVLTDVPDTAAVWEEEIFGPVMVVRTYTNLDEAIQYVNERHQPLSMYIFSRKNKNINYILQETRCGGVTVNDCGIHFINSDLPFGGVNNSGIGKSHGHAGFLEFVNQRGVLRQTRFFPSTNLLLPPYGGAVQRLLLKAIMRWL